MSSMVGLVIILVEEWLMSSLASIYTIDAVASGSMHFFR